MTAIIRRLLQTIFVLLAMSAIVFIGVNIIGNPVDILINPDASEAEKARLIAHLGLDQPFWRQYLVFLRGVLHGDFGDSFVYGRPAMGLIMERVPATLELAFSALLIALVIGLPLGLYAGLNPQRWTSRLIMTGSILGFSLPTFWVGLMLVLVLCVQFGLFPPNSRGETAQLFGVAWSFLTRDGLAHLVLPAVNLALFQTSMVLRLTRAGVQEILPQDFIKFAWAKGLTRRRIVFVHVLKNLMIPIVTIIGLEFGSLIAFSIVTESIFNWPGMGKLIIDSINMLDRPVIVAYLMVMVVLFVLLNFMVDVFYTILDPRVRLESGK